MALKGRLSIFGLVALLAVVVFSWAVELVIVEDWAGGVPGTKGIPASWQSQTWGQPRYDFALVAEGRRNVLHTEEREREFYD